MSSLKLSRRLLYSVRFVFVSTFNLQRGGAFVVGITNLSKQTVCVKAKAPVDTCIGGERGTNSTEFERSPRKSTRRASRELQIPQPTVRCVMRRHKALRSESIFWITLYYSVSHENQHYTQTYNTYRFRSINIQTTKCTSMFIMYFIHSFLVNMFRPLIRPSSGWYYYKNTNVQMLLHASLPLHNN